ncbi:hypothetical protein F0562_032971 [Nyssa sinensis]|uniref:Uncharacterized protein n=1 Tax=Nyssa sinensis TaxID=561372 RepID=A0A5J5AT57_9ASTE|nr:hypothetical protein F0562_032971 [Nyssa sinensis]
MLRMKSGESVADYFSRTMGIVNKMRIHEDKTKDVTIIEKILRSMTPKFNFVVCSIEESKDIDELSIEELQGSLQTIPTNFDGENEKETQQPHQQEVLAVFTTAATSPAAAEHNEQDDAIASSHPQRVRRRPAWMQDYEVLQNGFLVTILSVPSSLIHSGLSQCLSL